MQDIIIFVPAILIGVLILVTLLIIAVEKLVGSNQPKTITINKRTQIPVVGSDTVLNTLSDHKINIPSSCAGKATCGTCKFRLINPHREPRPTELPFLNKEERESGVRLSCQVKVSEDMEIELPESLLSAESFKTKVTHIQNLTHDIKLVRFELLNGKTINFKPGQFVEIMIPGVEETRAYSIASNPKHTNYIELIIRQVYKGMGTTFIHKALDNGDTIKMIGPFGDFYLNEESDRDIIAIAGGSGMAPMRSIIDYLADRKMPRKFTYFFGALQERDLFYTEEFREIEKKFKNFKYIPALSNKAETDNWDGDEGLITEVLDKYSGDLSNKEAYLCGSAGMINACIKVLLEHGMPEENISFDKF